MGQGSSTPAPHVEIPIDLDLNKVVFVLAQGETVIADCLSVCRLSLTVIGGCQSTVSRLSLTISRLSLTVSYTADYH